MDVDVVAQAYLFYLLSTTLFTNHGNAANLALLPPLQDLDATKQFNYGAAILSYLYYDMDLCVRGAHLKISYKRAIELLIHVPPSTEFDPFVEVEELDRGQGIILVHQQQRGKRMRRGSEPKAPNTAIVTGEPGQVLRSLFFWIA
ncbi:hypothetical protein JCGZ_26499 [Jatropha curcas]|uniref:Aminotransferase-like plant mobile domain-containing protein n=1 Tax=Jatropha curcas TaxID=180498 RepID=A0A067JXJ1_JATCU|nr:hypothetical protein JCGZ_26499 [Jatropha curcas]